MSKTFYENPTQVVFADPDNPGEWLMGIAYRDEIICSCCGGVFEIADVIENNSFEKPIYEYLYWEDITDAIYGGELPEGLEISDQEDRLVEVDEDEYVQGSLFDEDEEWITGMGKTFL